MSNINAYKASGITARFIGLSAFLLMTACTTQLSSAKYLSGMPYMGTLQSGFSYSPVITKFRVEKGEIVGSYSFKDRDVITDGTIKDCQVESPWSMVCTWQDKYGTGGLRVLFDSNGGAFSGFWGLENDKTMIHWNGRQMSDPKFPEEAPNGVRSSNLTP
ncbi:MAG: hypothetical protein CVV46_16415 [Spirochaetae bacterium HGW-Spirochaetae-2]|jgi:hypothetical protein|nr:MAG: hypothetical protein CVV46_16415 [Spirochaetae bacterium HGW-Spirochaetae-2]